MKAQIYINRHIVAANKKATKDTGRLTDRPAISIHTYKGSIYAKEVEFKQGCKLIQNAADARCSGATIWLECDDFETLLVDGVKAERSMFNKHKEINLEDYFWQFVSDAAWQKNTNYRAIACRLSSKYGADKSALQTMFRELQRELMKKLDGTFRSGGTPQHVPYQSSIQLGVSDDSFEDLTAHIIGMGKEEYYSIMDSPEKAISYRDSVVESFAYVLLNLED